MRRPTILDLVQAVIEVAPSHPEVAVWWYRRASVLGVQPVMVVLETRDGATPDTASIGAELARRLGPSAVAVRMHGGAGEEQELYRLLTVAEARAAAGQVGGT
jgi:hypothetical protein